MADCLHQQPKLTNNMNNKKINPSFSVITVIILLAAFSRLIPHPANFAPIGGMALFGATYYTRKGWAYLVPIAAMWISDLILNNVVYAQYFDRFVWFYSGSLFTYGAFALIVLMGTFTLRKVRVPRLLFSALGASIIFFWSPTSACGFPQQCIPKPQPVLQPAMRRESRSLKTRCWATWYIRRPSSGCSKYRFRGFPGCVYTLKIGRGRIRKTSLFLIIFHQSIRPFLKVEMRDMPLFLFRSFSNFALLLQISMRLNTSEAIYLR